MANAITDPADFMVAPLIGNILVMINKACSVEDDVVMDMIFINMGTDHIFYIFLSVLRQQIAALSDGHFRHQLLQLK